MSITHITDNTVDQTLADNTVAVLYFSAAWCKPCVHLGPVMEEVAAEFEGRAFVGKVDVDTEAGASIKHRVRSLPTLAYFQNGTEVFRTTGAQAKTAIVGMLTSVLKGAANA